MNIKEKYRLKYIRNIYVKNSPDLNFYLLILVL